MILFGRFVAVIISFLLNEELILDKREVGSYEM